MATLSSPANIEPTPRGARVALLAKGRVFLPAPRAAAAPSVALGAARRPEWSLMAVTWQSQPNSARSTSWRRRRLASGPSSHEAVALPPATPFPPRARRRSSGHRVASVDVVSLDEVSTRRRSYAIFSPYAPLPAIGADAPGETHTKDTSAVMADGEMRPRFLRERTYSVIEPVFVRGPAHPWAQHVRSKVRFPAVCSRRRFLRDGALFQRWYFLPCVPLLVAQFRGATHKAPTKSNLHSTFESVSVSDSEIQ